MKKWSKLIFPDSADCCLVVFGSSDMSLMYTTYQWPKMKNYGVTNTLEKTIDSSQEYSLSGAEAELLFPWYLM